MGTKLYKMKKRNLFLLLFFFAFAFAQAQPDKPALRFRPDGTFTVMQMTDLHWRPNEGHLLDMLRFAIRYAQPDLIILTGDIVTGADTRKGWTEITGVLSDAQIPWAVVFGNHDPEHEMTKPQIIEMLSALPYNLTENGPDGISGNGNYVLTVGGATSPATKAALYCFDSRQQDNWIDYTQMNWYREQSAAFAEQNGGDPLPSLAFFHIPLHEYNDVAQQTSTVGECNERVCFPPLNGGLLAAFTECKDVMGMFVGHDHSNNYIGCLHNVCLAYGYTTALAEGGFYSKVGRGVRIIELFENQRRFDSWLLRFCDEPTGRAPWKVNEQPVLLHKVSYPASFTPNVTP
ncbi:MAG: metallophosphoesterase [Bacteroidales bacterium]